MAAMMETSSRLVGGLGSLPGRRSGPVLCSCGSVLVPYSRVFSFRSICMVSGRKLRKGNRAVVGQFSGGRDRSLRVLNSAKEPSESKVEDVDLAKLIAEARDADSATVRRRNKTVQPPRFATLRAFGEAGGGVITGFEGTSVFELLAASVEATKQVRNWEVVSGRLAMMALFVAIGLEFYTGNSVFEGLHLSELVGAAGLCAVAAVSAAGFAYAWRAKADVVSMMSKNYKNMLDSALDNLIDGLFFDERR